MSWKVTEQRSLVDALVTVPKAVKELDDLHNLIDWSRILSKLSHIHRSTEGAKSWPPLLMFKVCLLQSWYNLSDVMMEKQLARDLLFRRFTHLSIADDTPSDSAIWRFHQILLKGNLLDMLLEEINHQLAQNNLYLKLGSVSIIDASVIEAKNCRPNKDKAGHSTQDPDATWNVKKNSAGKQKSTYGFKAHINVDEDGFVQKADFSSGSEHDSNYFECLLTDRETAVYADSAYQSKAHTALLKKRKTKNRLTRRAYRNRPLSEEDKAFNRLHASVRSTVERTFGILKNHYGMGKARCVGQQRNKGRLMMQCIAYNLKRGTKIWQDSCI